MKKKLALNTVKSKLIHNINKHRRILGYFPTKLDISLEELAILREELNINIEEELTRFNGIKLNILHEETC